AGNGLQGGLRAALEEIAQGKVANGKPAIQPSQESLTVEVDVMPKLRLLLRCIGEAVCVKGPKALLSLVPFGEVVYEVAEEAYRRLKQSGSQAEHLAAVAAAASATVEEARQEAQAAVAEIPAA